MFGCHFTQLDIDDSNWQNELSAVCQQCSLSKPISASQDN